MGLISLLFKEPIAFFILVIPLIYSVIIHEVAHGWVAYFFGDDTAKHSGRLSLNPVRHFDPMGMLMLFIVGFGWAKPVPVNYYNLKNFRIGLIFVSLAGCLANIIIAAVAIFLLQFQYVTSNTIIVSILVVLAKVNIILGAFNLIPIPPLDGSKILMGFLPKEAQWRLARLEPYGFFILIILLFTGLLDPVIIFVQNMILLLISAVVPKI
ncbi:MAG: site-2 protease family protein [Candidatus Omnitrophica bacterium CG07_land_8_20_14_0_80_42_15]|uniref:Site-2 protease family protein n=1 Tax=Candidatus Aquitaenariimonas noxiae TaxID=1974741 RepID=A0A2J0KT04_9BACT|nr:MAG: site-2 protease family protein [Candidatus Omnitrophica bacterium CG07_land_8_20_14_0_80_42_15]